MNKNITERAGSHETHKVASNYNCDLCALRRNHAVRSALIIGDMVHGMAIQFALSEAAISSDQDRKQSISARQDLFRRAAEIRVLSGGMRMPFPGIGHIRFEGEKGYARAPIEFSPIP